MRVSRRDAHPCRDDDIPLVIVAVVLTLEALLEFCNILSCLLARLDHFSRNFVAPAPQSELQGRSKRSEAEGRRASLPSQ